MDTAYNKHAEAVAKAVRMRADLDKKRNQKKQIEDHAVKKFLRSRAFKTIVNRAVAANMDKCANLRGLIASTRSLTRFCAFVQKQEMEQADRSKI